MLEQFLVQLSKHRTWQVEESNVSRAGILFWFFMQASMQDRMRAALEERSSEEVWLFFFEPLPEIQRIYQQTYLRDALVSSLKEDPFQYFVWWMT